ncbi:recombinase RecA [Candidatus Daviesbacteria bacterium]|nr:recombinase RecA [Candidatus Daviesbacteria bacterium]
MAQNNSSNNEAKKAAISAAMAQIQKQYGTGSIMRLGERVEKFATDTIPTGSIALDLALGVGGLPKGRIIEIYGPEAGGKCVTTDTVVFTEYGMVPIGFLGDLNQKGFQPKEIKVYSEGGFAYTSHFYNSGVQKTIKIKTSYGFELEGTPNHRVRVLDNQGEYIWRRLDQLKIDDSIAIQRGQYCFGSGADLSNFGYIKNKNNSRGKDFNPPSVLTSDLARLMGYLVGDGTCTSGGFNKNDIQITIADDEIAEDFSNLCLRIFGETPKITLDKRTKNTQNFRIHNAKARVFLAYAGLDYVSAEGKEIPYSVMQGSQTIVANFLSALFETDGCFSTNTIEYYTKSIELIKQLQLVLLNFGIVSRIKPRQIKNYPGNTYYYLYIDGINDQKIFYKEIGFISKRKNEKLLFYIQRERQYQSNRDTVPFINHKIDELMKDYRISLGSSTRQHWDAVYDYRSATPGHSSLTYPRLNKILNIFQPVEKLSVYQELKEIFLRNIFWDKIVEMQPSKSLVVDFTVPETLSFFGSGFINHNTTVALHVIAEAQKKGGVAAFIDAEHALDPQRAQKIGVNLDDLLISQPDTGEQGLEIAESLIRSGGIDVLVIDSVAALVPRSELEGEMGDSSMGVQARLMSQALRKLTGAVSNTNTIVIFTNQLRQKIGVMFGNPETTTGGLALKFYSSIRLDVRKIENIKDGDLVVGSRHRVKVVKNKVAPPFRIAEFDMDENGISHEGELLDVGIELGILTKSGAFIKWKEKLLGQGRAASAAYLKENKKEAEKLEKEIRDAWTKQKEGKEKIVVGQEEETSAGALEEAV